MSDKQLAGKVAIVTGAAKGIGAGIATAMAAAGAKVVVNYVSGRADAERVVSGITAAGGTAIAISADVSRSDQLRRLFAGTKEHFGRLDVLVNNAGVFAFAPLEQVTAEEFHRQFDINVLGPILASREAVALFGDGGGAIVNIGSGISHSPLPGSVVYAATKGAIDVVTRQLAIELGPRRIRVNSIQPGLVDTEGARQLGIIESELAREFVGHTPLGRIGRPDDIGDVAVFLASDAARWITGESLLVAGGRR